MKTNVIAFAAKAKGPFALLKRARSIAARYGITPAKMDRALDLFARTLREFDCGASFPLTAVALRRNGGTIVKYLDQNIEFAVHGYTHTDYSHLPPEEQFSHLRRARQTFAAFGIQVAGFRCPYLRWNVDTLAAVRQEALTYDSSQTLAWDVLDGLETGAYRRVLDFYGAQPAADHPALPRLSDGLVRIPYCLPDDEALVERLHLADPEAMAEVWLEVFRRTHELGELFTLGLHPERIVLCEEPLRAVLSRARSLSPSVWMARLDEIADWWRSRAQTTFRVDEVTKGAFRLIVDGPAGATVLARSVVIDGPTERWSGNCQRVLSGDFVFRAQRLPLIGISPDCPGSLADFLQQQGYLICRGVDARSCEFYLDEKEFAPGDERPLLSRLEEGTGPLLRLARWPHAAQSALCVSGDIDALTLWDYVLRVFNS